MEKDKEPYIKISEELAKNIGNLLDVNWAYVDLDEFRRGIEVEMEHGLQFGSKSNVIQGSLIESARIALAHLYEISDYYTRLDEMETEAEKEDFSVKEQKIISLETKDILINEGLIDWIKKGVQSVSKQWNKVKGKLSKSAQTVMHVLRNKKKQVQQAYNIAEQHYNELKQLEQETGENLPEDETIQMAKSLNKQGEQAIEEVRQDKQEVQQAINQQQLSAQQEAYAITANALIEEMIEDENELIAERVLLKEADPVGLVGLGLGMIGGIPMILKGLMNLSKFLKLEKTTEFFEKLHHISEVIEERAVDWVVPDKLSYAWYKKKHKTVSKDEQPMGFEEYKNSDVREKVEKQMYIVMLIPFFLNGLSAAVKAGMSMIGAAESAASTVKAVEIGKTVLNTAKTVGQAATEA